jgi:hypothetical protein
MSPANAEQLVLSSVLLSIASWRFRVSSKEPYAVPCEELRTSSAAVQVYLSTWSWLESKNSNIHSLFNSLHFMAKQKELHSRRRYSDVVAMLEGLEGQEPDNGEGEELIRYLMSVHSCLYQAESRDVVRHQVVQAALNPPQSLIPRLQEKEPQALAIWARIISLWTEIEGSWWIADVVEYELSGIREIFDDCGYDESLLSWPVARVTWEGE